MAYLRIYDVDQPPLRALCKHVKRMTGAERMLIDDMFETMRSANGIGLAAPQVGILQRIIVVDTGEYSCALVNPEVISTSEETETMEEGCLSMPNYFGPVERPVRAVVRGLSQTGKRVKIRADGLLARVLQHEIDHLDGILFLDRMQSLDSLRYVDPSQPESDDESDDEEGADPEAALAASIGEREQVAVAA
jgi:peptide deformylase